jgi:Glycosyl transferase 4-like domain
LRILLLTSKLEPSDPANERWAQLSSSFRNHGLSLVSVGVQVGRKLDSLALQQAEDFHAQQAFDLVISSGPPIGAHLTAQVFSRTAGISWVADWSEPFALESHKILGWFDRRLEAKLLRAADQVIVSSEALAHKYRAFRGDHDASLLVVRNGFDRNELRLAKQRTTRERLRIVCSQTTSFNPLPFLETLQTQANLRESLEVIFSHASAQVAHLVQAFELEDCVHCLNASESATAALEVSADVLLTFGLNSAYRSPAGLARVLARQRPILHVFENALDPSFEVSEGTPHLPSENNRFALTAALEAAIQGNWVMPSLVSSMLSPEQYCWDAIGRSLIGFVYVDGSDRAVSGMTAGVARQAVSGLAAKI